MQTTSVLLEQIDTANLSAPQWRTARRILDRIHPENGYVRLSYDEMAAIVGSDSQATVRGHLAALAAAGLITYRRNSAIHIYWHLDDAIATRADCSAPRAESSAARAPEPPAAPEPADPARATRAESSATRANCSATRAESSATRTASLKAITSRQAGKQVDLPASQPAGKGSGENQPPEPPSGDALRTIAMLTDPAIGLDELAAQRIAARHAPGPVLAQCCRYLRDLAVGKVDGPSVIGYRLAKAYGGSVIPADHRTAFWQRHGPAAADVASQTDAAAERRRKYAPPELAGIVIGVSYEESSTDNGGDHE